MKTIPTADISIVLAEDDDGQATLVERHLHRAGSEARFLRVRNGLELLEILDRNTELARRPLLILMDIRMPYLDGIETLSRLKTKERTAVIPVYILSTTDDPREVERCFRLGCNAYIVKPILPDALIEAIRRLTSFLEITTLPATIPDATA